MIPPLSIDKNCTVCQGNAANLSDDVDPYRRKYGQMGHIASFLQQS